LIIDEALDRLGRETIDQVLRGLRQYATGMSLLVLTSREELAAQLQRSLHLGDARLLAGQEA
jgi:ABC-type lipoprotein export system ATPase subunit